MTERHPGRPQDQAIRARILAAASDIVGRRGLEACTFEAVAAQAGTSRPAIYRRWSRMEDLVAEAIDAGRPQLTLPDSGSFEGDLRQGAVDFLGQYGTPLARQAVLEILRTSIQDGPTAQTWASRYGAPRMEAFRPVFLRAIERGELSSDADIETMMFVLSSTLLQASLLGDVTGIVAPDAIDRVISLLLEVGENAGRGQVSDVLSK
jgi:AcrR family transcriptional regulator